MKRFFTIVFLLSTVLVAGVSFSCPDDEMYDDACEAPIATVQDSGIADELALIAGLVATITLLMKILKLRTVNEFLKRHKKKWIKPYISITLGAALGGLTAYQTGMGLFPSIVAGLMAGASAIGVHEAVNKRKPEKREK